MWVVLLVLCAFLCSPACSRPTPPPPPDYLANAVDAAAPADGSLATFPTPGPYSRPIYRIAATSQKPLALTPKGLVHSTNGLDWTLRMPFSMTGRPTLLSAIADDFYLDTNLGFASGSDPTFLLSNLRRPGGRPVVGLARIDELFVATNGTNRIFASADHERLEPAATLAQDESLGPIVVQDNLPFAVSITNFSAASM